MTVKSTVVEKETETKDEFPVLMEFHNGSFVVLFTGVKSGTVVMSKNPTNSVGDYSDEWIPCNNELKWNPFKGRVVLENT